LVGDAIGSCNYIEETAVHHSPAPVLQPPASASASAACDVMWKTASLGDDDAVMMHRQPPQQHYAPSYNCYSTPVALPSVPPNNMRPWPPPQDYSDTCMHTHCKTSVHRKNTERHKDRVTTSHSHLFFLCSLLYHMIH